MLCEIETMLFTDAKLLGGHTDNFMDNFLTGGVWFSWLWIEVENAACFEW